MNAFVYTEYTLSRSNTFNRTLNYFKTKSTYERGFANPRPREVLNFKGLNHLALKLEFHQTAIVENSEKSNNSTPIKRKGWPVQYL